MTRWLFTLVYLLPEHKGKSMRIEESIVATSWEEAREYWSREFEDKGIEVEQMLRVCPVIAISPLVRGWKA